MRRICFVAEIIGCRSDSRNEDGTSPSVNRNVVRGINPPGQIWTIADLRAEVSVDGRIRVSGKGLRLAGVPLELDGDFEIDNVLTPAPSDCASPVLLIRNVPGTWFAAGIPVVEKHRS